MNSLSDYYDHYKDTFEIQRSNLSERNKLTVSLFVLLILMVGFIYDPDMLNKQVNTYIGSLINGLAFDMKVLNTGIIFLTLWVLVRYYQLVIEVERIYRYLSEVESKLSEDNVYKINREGAFYLKSYPWFNDVVNFSYVVLLPVVIIATALVKIINESSWTTHFKWVDFMALGLIILFSALYLSNRVLKEESFDKQRYPNMCWCDRLFRYLRFM